MLIVIVEYVFLYVCSEIMCTFTALSCIISYMNSYIIISNCLKQPNCRQWCNPVQHLVVLLFQAIAELYLQDILTLAELCSW